MFLPTAKDIWDFLIGETYFKVKDLTLKAWSTKQGTQLVAKYANLLRNWWQELD